jgi:hypothetical protein
MKILLTPSHRGAAARVAFDQPAGVQSMNDILLELVPSTHGTAVSRFRAINFLSARTEGKFDLAEVT